MGDGHEGDSVKENLQASVSSLRPVIVNIECRLLIMFLSIQSIVCILFVIINGLVNRQGPHPLDPAFGTARLSKDILKPFFSHLLLFLCDSSNTIQRAFSLSFG